MADRLAPIAVEHAAQVQEAVRAFDRVTVRGGGTKPAMALAPLHSPAQPLDLHGLRGIIEYEPQEYTFTARAGTPLAEVNDLLAANGQYLPFDPVLVEAGATLGGTVASGLSGSGRLRYGGVRDFILGVRFVDGSGAIVQGGGKVVKNAAGFDFPKLLTGSMGRLGVIVEVSFKVFPAPPAYRSLFVRYPNIQPALEAVYALTTQPVDLVALDLLPGGAGEGWTLALRIGGAEALLASRLDRLQRLLTAGDAMSSLAGDDEARFWRDAAEFTWTPAGSTLIKVPLTPAQIAALESRLAATTAPRRYAVAGNVLWIAWPHTLTTLEAVLIELGLAGVVVRGQATFPWIGHAPASAFARRIKAALDPDGKFPPFFPD